MKKILCLILLILMLSCVSCRPKQVSYEDRVVITGDYFTIDGKIENKNGEYFSGAKYILKEITKEEYDIKNGENVFGIVVPRKKPKTEYFSIELYLLITETNQYEHATLTNIICGKNSFDLFNCDFIINSGTEDISGELHFWVDVLNKNLNRSLSSVSVYVNDYCFYANVVNPLMPLINGIGLSIDNYNKVQGNEYFTKLKYTLKEITKEEYESAKGVNVFIDEGCNYFDITKYLSIELCVWLNETNEYVRMDITNLKYIRNDKYRYEGNFSISINDNVINGQIAISPLQGYNKFVDPQYTYFNIYNDDFSFSTYIFITTYVN